MYLTGSFFEKAEWMKLKVSKNCIERIQRERTAFRDIVNIFIKNGAKKGKNAIFALIINQWRIQMLL